MILFVGDLQYGSNALSLLKGFRKAGVTCNSVDTSMCAPSRFSVKRIMSYFFPTFYSRVCSFFLTKKILFALRSFKPEMFFVFKGNYVSKKILRKITCVKIHFHPDDSSAPINRSYVFDLAENYYDLHITTRSQNVDEIKVRTGRDALLTYFAYDKDWHFVKSPIDFTNRKFIVGFIGHFRSDRSHVLDALSNKYGKSLLVVGDRWRKSKDLSGRSTVQGAKYGKDFSEVIQLAPVQIGFLNSANRDEHTCRTFEIPAAGGLIIAKDTSEHRKIFSIPGSALFFDNSDDICSHLEWINANPQSASKIASRGHSLIVEGSNSWDDRAIKLLAEIKSRENNICQ